MSAGRSAASRTSPPDVAFEIFRGRTAEGLDELVVWGVELMDDPDVVAARGHVLAWLAADDDMLVAARLA